VCVFCQNPYPASNHHGVAFNQGHFVVLPGQVHRQRLAPLAASNDNSILWFWIIHLMASGLRFGGTTPMKPSLFIERTVPGKDWHDGSGLDSWRRTLRLTLLHRLESFVRC
jgi:hypothetical protein